MKQNIYEVIDLDVIHIAMICSFSSCIGPAIHQIKQILRLSTKPKVSKKAN